MSNPLGLRRVITALASLAVVAASEMSGVAQEPMPPEAQYTPRTQLDLNLPMLQLSPARG
ncbi:MAG: hypothetical protein ACFLMY_14065 [Candidatus Brachytrichaceae bacterium NZ_4S206]|jgi:hypothetical protein